MYDLVRDHVFHSLAGRLEILARVKVIGVLGEILADIACHGKTDIRVDVDLADSQLGSLPELIFRDANGVGHISAVIVDHLDKLLRDGGRAVEHDREARETLDALMQHVEAQRRRNKNAVSIAGALGSLEFIGAVGSSDGNRERVAAGVLTNSSTSSGRV